MLKDSSFFLLSIFEHSQFEEGGEFVYKLMMSFLRFMSTIQLYSKITSYHTDHVIDGYISNVKKIIITS